jgi:hypothetical protein
MNRLPFITLFLIFGTFRISASENRSILEHVFVQTDRDIYIAGETLFFDVNILSNDSSDLALSKVCYLVLRDSKHLYNKLYIKVNKKNSFGSLYLPDTLKTGNYEIVAFTNYMRNFDESTFFRKKLIIVNRFDEWLKSLFQENNSTNAIDSAAFQFIESVNCPVKISLEKDSFRTREKIKIHLEIKESLKSQFNGNVSVSVKEMNPYTRYYIDQDIKDVKPGKVNNNSGAINYPVEKNGIYINGVILNKDSLPVPNECLFLSTKDTIANLQYTFSDKFGKFHFYLTDYYLEKQLIISTREDRKGQTIILLEDKFQLKQPFEPLIFGFTRELRKYILESQNIVKIQKAYSIKNVKPTPYLGENFIIPYVYKEPSSRIYPADYLALKNFQEITENILPGCKLKSEGNVSKIYVMNYVAKHFFQEPATVFLDGIPIYNLGQIMNYGTNEIYKVDMCKIPRIKGKIAFDGVVAISTFSKTATKVMVPGSATYTMGKFVDYSVYDTPDYSKKPYSASVPDFRQLLYWNPVLSLDSHHDTIEFYSSDWQTDYVIELKGINKDGKPFFSSSKLKVYR